VELSFYQTCDPACSTSVNSHISGCDQSTSQCQCAAGYGPNNQAPYCVNLLCNVPCNNGGTCDYTTGNCNCLVGWTGISCTVPTKGYLCPKNYSITNWPSTTLVACSGSQNGLCSQTTGLCQCYTAGMPYYGLDCSQRDCAPSGAISGCGGTSTCCGHGQCLTLADWNNPQFQNAGGIGSCLCNAMYTGSHCELASLPCTPTDCYGNGVCDHSTGYCICNSGYGGPAPFRDCSQCVAGYEVYNGNCVPIRTCPGDCNAIDKHGVCNTATGICQCAKDSSGYLIWTGADCSIAACPNSCTYQGQCKQCNSKAQTCSRANICQCNSGWQGTDCSQHEKRKTNLGLAVGLPIVLILLLAAFGLYMLRLYKIQKFKEQQGTEMK